MSEYLLISDVDCGLLGERDLLVEVEWLDADNGGGDTSPKSAGYVIESAGLLPVNSAKDWIDSSNEERASWFKYAHEIEEIKSLWDYCQEQIDNGDYIEYQIHRREK